MASTGWTPPWKLAPQNTYILRNASIVHPIDGSVVEGATIRLSNGTIQSVTAAAGDASSIAQHETLQGSEITIDLQGKFVCPGLIDVHVHIAAVPGEKDLRDTLGLAEQISYLRQPYVCLQMIRRGFTTARDCGGASLALKEAIADGVIVGPRLFIAGRLLTQTGGSADPRGPHDDGECCSGGPKFLGRVCDGVPECTKGAREAIRTGSDFIKIMSGGSITGPSEKITSVQFTAEEIQAIATVAKNSGTYVTAHAYTPAAIYHALDNGAMGIEHGNLLDADVAKYMAAKGAFLTPTLSTYAVAASPDFEGSLDPNTRAKLQEVLGAGQRSLQIASEAGVDICFGTDLLGPMVAAQTKEFALRAKVLSPVAILQSATVTAARLLRQADFLGQIKPGFAADLLLLNANPLENIEIFDEPEKHLLGVFKDGRVQVSRWSKLREDIVAPISMIE